MTAGAPIQISGSMTDGESPQVLWKRVIGQVQRDMKQRGWTGGRILEASWKDALLFVSVGPGHGRIDVDALSEFIREQRRKAR